METLTEKERQEFEFRLQVIENLEKSIKEYRLQMKLIVKKEEAIENEKNLKI